MSLLATPLGWIMKLCYAIVKNYGIALFLFTFITRLVVFPLSVKQQKSTARMSMINPEIEKLKKKYANNKEKLNEETMKLYSQENVNPMASCLPMIITMVILFSLIYVIYSPLTYVEKVDDDKISSSVTLVTNLYDVSEKVHDKGDSSFKNIVKEVGTDSEKIAKELKNDKYDIDLDDDKLDNVAEIIAKHDDIDEYLLSKNFPSKLITQKRAELPVISIANNDKYSDILDEEIVDASTKVDYNLFGKFLGNTPSYKFPLNWMVVIPIISALFQLATTIVSQSFSKKNNPAAASMGGSMKIMLYAMPLFSLGIGFTFPAALGLYWIYSSFFALLQTIVLNVVYTPEKVKAMVQKDKEKNKNKKKKPSFYEKAMAMQNEKNQTSDDSSDDVEEEFDEDRKLSKAELKELQRKKINEARRRMAEKYGDEYDESEK